MAELLSTTQITTLRSFIDIVRSNNVQVDLPSIVVCGATSSGKSSLLSAISGVVLPSDSDICTKCPASICMENSPTTQCKIRILWSKTNAAFGKKGSNRGIQDLESWETCDHSELTNKIRESQNNILKFDEIESGVSSSVIDVSISGPNHPNLTIIDLPGIVKTVGEDEDKQIKQQIDDLIDSYIKNPLCIILVVHPADVDFHNSEMFERAKKYDPDTKRTFPVITKADKIDEGEEKNVIKLVSGGFVKFSLGFHLVKLRSQKEIDEDCTADSVVKAEMEWFKSSRFGSVQHSDLGIVNLRQRLAAVYIEHLNSNIQKVIDCITARRQSLEKELEGLGLDVSTEPARNRILTTVTQRIVGKLCGYGALTSEPLVVPGQEPLATIRAIIEYLKQQLVKDIVPREFSDLVSGDVVNKVIHGASLPCVAVSRASDPKVRSWTLVPQDYSKWTVAMLKELTGQKSAPEDVVDDIPCFEDNKYVKLGEKWDYLLIKDSWYHLKWIDEDSLHLCYKSLVDQINSHRHSPMAIFEGEPVFHDHVRRWVDGQVRKACRVLIKGLHTMIKYDISIFASPNQHPELQLYPRLDAAISEAADYALELWMEHLEDAMNDFLDHQMDPSTLNHYFSDTIIKLRHQPLLDRLLTKQQALIPPDSTKALQVVPVSEIKNIFNELSSKNIVEFVAEETAINLRAYYKVARKNIADGVADVIDHSLKFDKAPSSYQHGDQHSGRRNGKKSDPRDLAGILRDQFSKIDCSTLFTNNAAAARRAQVESELEGLRLTLKELPRLRANLL